MYKHAFLWASCAFGAWGSAVCVCVCVCVCEPGRHGGAQQCPETASAAEGLPPPSPPHSQHLPPPPCPPDPSHCPYQHPHSTPHSLKGACRSLGGPHLKVSLRQRRRRMRGGQASGLSLVETLKRRMHRSESWYLLQAAGCVCVRERGGGGWGVSECERERERVCV